MTAPGWDRFEVDDFERLAKLHGTPMYVYDADAVIARVEEIRAAFGGLTDVYYAVKANPNLALLRALNGVVDGLDISSAGELEQAELAGFDLTRTSFAGPAKTFDELSAAVSAGACVSVESVRELGDIATAAQQHDRKANILLRVNPAKMVRSFGLKMGGKATQFGIEEEELASVATRVLGDDRLTFRGIHVYAGSQCFDPEGLRDGVENTLRIATTLEADTGAFCAVINLGGGFGVSHGIQTQELDVDEAGVLLQPLLEAFHAKDAEARRVVFELGRYLTANAGVYVTRVVSEKRSRRKQFFMADGGLNHHLSAAGTFGTALRSNFQLRNLSRPDAPTSVVSIAGPSCNPTDLLGVDVELATPKIGDLLAVMKSGSYGLTASPVLFLGRRSPAEVVFHKGKFVLGRRSMSITDFN